MPSALFACLCVILALVLCSQNTAGFQLPASPTGEIQVKSNGLFTHCSRDIVFAQKSCSVSSAPLPFHRPLLQKMKASDEETSAGYDDLTLIEKLAAGSGLVAVPVVLYSEWVLKATGCGLPPGPFGALGALEGISYLVVVGIAALSITTKVRTGSGLKAGPGGILGAVEGMTFLAILAGLVVLGFQVMEYGYIPSATPDAKCFPESA